MDISGECAACQHRGQARLVAYYSGEVIIRCNHCHTAGQFTPDDGTYLDPNKFKPFLDDEDPGDTTTKRYTKGPR